MTGQDHGRLPDAATVRRAAIRWCGRKDRETFPDDVSYFEYNWRWASGLRAVVEEIMAEDVASECSPKGCGFCGYECPKFPAQAMSAGTAETLQGAQGDSPPARSEGCARTTPKSNDYGAI